MYSKVLTQVDDKTKVEHLVISDKDNVLMLLVETLDSSCNEALVI